MTFLAYTAIKPLKERRCLIISIWVKWSGSIKRKSFTIWLSDLYFSYIVKWHNVFKAQITDYKARSFIFARTCQMHTVLYSSKGKPFIWFCLILYYCEFYVLGILFLLINLVYFLFSIQLFVMKNRHAFTTNKGLRLQQMENVFFFFIYLNFLSY